MSQGIACRCGEHKKPVKERRWVVLQRNQRCSAFDGYQVRFSDYSCVQCHVCGHCWRTKAGFVDTLPNGKNLYDMATCKGCPNKVDKEHVDKWNGYCDACLEAGRNFDADPVNKHATVKLGEYTVPLIGVPPEATKEKCTRCGTTKHITELTLDSNGNPVCTTPCDPKP